MQWMFLKDTFHTCKFCGRPHQWQLEQIRSKLEQLTLRIPHKEKLKIQECLKKCFTLYLALIVDYYDKFEFGGLETLKRSLDQLMKQYQDIFFYMYQIVQEYQEGPISFFKKIIAEDNENNSLELIKRGLSKLIWLEDEKIIKFNNLQRNQVLGFHSLEENTKLQKLVSKALAVGFDDLIVVNNWPSEANQLKNRILKKFQSMQKCYSKKFADSSILRYCRGTQMFAKNSMEQNLLIYTSILGHIQSSTFKCMDEYDKICRSILNDDYKQLFKKYERLVGWFVFLDLVVGDLEFNPCAMVDYLVQNLVPKNVKRESKKIDRIQFVARMTEIFMCYYQNREQSYLGLNIKLYKIFEILFKDLPKNQIPKRIRSGIQFVVEVIKKIEKMYLEY